MNLAKVLIATKLKTYENFQVDVKYERKRYVTEKRLEEKLNIKSRE